MSYEIRKAVMTRLTADVALMANVPGGVWDRPIKQEGKGATPGVFKAVPGDPSREPIMQPTIEIHGPNQVKATEGPQTLHNGFFTVHYYVPATESGKVLLDTIDGQVKTLLHEWQFVLASTGETVTVLALERTEDIESLEFPGNKEQQRRFVVEYVE
jgi:hypothetical protein